jgi:MFS family permease
MSEAGATVTAEPMRNEAAPRIAIVFTGLVLVMLLAALDSTIVSTALPTIVGELGGFNHLSWVVTAYLLAQTIVTPLYGKLATSTGARSCSRSGSSSSCSARCSVGSRRTCRS